MTRSKATLIGLSAILLWSLLALLTVGTAPVPPFQLNALCFGVGGLLGLGWLVMTGALGELRHVSARVYLFGTAALFLYHALYFSALRIAPPAEAGLIAYLWPLLIVLLSGLLPGERLRLAHLFGAVLAFGGVALLVLGGGDAGFDAKALPGFGLALLCAVIWSVYSVGSRVMGAVPTAAVVVFCLATAALSLVVHLGVETTAWPSAEVGWIAVAALGLGPVGLAFFTWDIGMKKGDIQLLGVASYAAPLLSTLALIVAGRAEPRLSLVLSAVLITGGALLAARASLARDKG